MSGHFLAEMDDMRPAWTSASNQETESETDPLDEIERRLRALLNEVTWLQLIDEADPRLASQLFVRLGPGLPRRMMQHLIAMGRLEPE